MLLKNIFFNTIIYFFQFLVWIMKLVKVILYFVLQQMEVCLLFICLFCLLFLFFITKNQLFVYFFTGGQHTTTRVNINIIDVNDNYPRFEVQSYKRAIPEGNDVYFFQIFVSKSHLFVYFLYRFL